MRGESLLRVGWEFESFRARNVLPGHSVIGATARQKPLSRHGCGAILPLVLARPDARVVFASSGWVPQGTYQSYWPPT